MPKRERHLAVFLHETKIGEILAYEDYSRFVLNQSYIHNPSRDVLGLQFEQDLSVSHKSNVRLPPWFSNLLPEGKLRTWIANERGVSEAREYELLEVAGKDLPGAALVIKEDGLSNSTEETARELVSTSSGRPTRSSWRFSLAGVAMKFSMLKQGERFTAPGVGSGGDWIIKLPDSNYPCVPLNEFSMMQLAKHSGINVPEILLVHRDSLDSVPPNLWPPGEEYAYAIQRFDRKNNGRRVHIEDLAQVRGVYPENKYFGSFETIAALIYRNHDVESLTEFSKRLAFNILIGNGDAHLKNWSLIYENPRVPKISPAYDLVATGIYRPLDRPEDLGLKFGGSRKFESVSLATFEELQKKLNVDNVSIPDQLHDFIKRVQDSWGLVEEDLVKANPIFKKLKDSMVGRSKTLSIRKKFQRWK